MLVCPLQQQLLANQHIVLLKNGRNHAFLTRICLQALLQFKPECILLCHHLLLFENQNISLKFTTYDQITSSEYRQTDSQPCSILQSWMQSKLSELKTKQRYSLTGSQERKRIDLVSVLQYLLLSRHHRHCQRIWEEEEEEEESAEPKLLLLYNPTSGYLGDQDHQAPSGVTGFLRGGRERRTRGNHLLHCCRGRRASKRAKESAVAITIVAGWFGIEGFLTLVLRQLSYNRDLENLHFLSQDLSAQRLSPFFRGLCSGCRYFLRIGEQGLTEKCSRFQLLACEREISEDYLCCRVEKWATRGFSCCCKAHQHECFC